MASFIDSSYQLSTYQEVAAGLALKLKISLKAVLAQVGHINRAVKAATIHGLDPLVDLQIDSIVSQQLLLLQQSLWRDMDKAFEAFETNLIKMVQNSLNTHEDLISKRIFSQTALQLKAQVTELERIKFNPVTFASVENLLHKVPSKVS